MSKIEIPQRMTNEELYGHERGEDPHTQTSRGGSRGSSDGIGLGTVLGFLLVVACYYFIHQVTKGESAKEKRERLERLRQNKAMATEKDEAGEEGAALKTARQWKENAPRNAHFTLQHFARELGLEFENSGGACIFLDEQGVEVVRIVKSEIDFRHQERLWPRIVESLQSHGISCPDSPPWYTPDRHSEGDNYWLEKGP